MKQKKYSREVERELKQLSHLASERFEANQLKSAISTLMLWQKRKIDTRKAIGDVRSIISSHYDLSDSNYEVSVAHAISTGLLNRKDISDQAWEAIDFFLTLADI